MPSSELALSRSFFDQTFAYVTVLIALYHFFQFIPSAVARHRLTRLLIVWVHIDFVLRCGEAALMYEFDMGYSSLFFYHLELASIRLALSQYWLLILGTAGAVAASDWMFRRWLVETPWERLAPAARIAVVLLLIVGARSAYVLHRERSRAPEDFAAAGFALNWKIYLDRSNHFTRVSLNDAERRYLRTLGIGLRRSPGPVQLTKPPMQPLNLITIYLEGFQANFTEAGGSAFPGLTPNLDRFASRALFMTNFYNAVTPTINALISSQCGVLSQIENDFLNLDRGYTRNLPCLSDILHDAGYRQVFVGGADSGFSGKRLFFKAHHFDEVWGWERWRNGKLFDAEHRNAWGLHDTDLVRQAMDVLSQLRAHPPFHLSILTVNTHQPGYVAPDCPEYRSGRLMLNAIHCADYAVGMLMAELERRGDFANTAVIVMGDHTMFPTTENADALGAAALGWFGKVFMAISWPGGPRPGRIDTPGYTPDFAPIALDVLGFKPVPAFAFGSSPITRPDRRRTLVAEHFQILKGRIIPDQPTLDDHGCAEALLERTRLNWEGERLSPCGRKRIVESVEEQMLSGRARPRTSND